MDILLAAAAVIVVAIIAFSAGRRSGARATAARESVIAERDRVAAELRASLAAANARLDERDKAHAGSIAALQATRQEMTDRFQALASEILEAKSRTFLAQNEQSLGQLLAPLRAELDGFRKKVDDVYVKEAEGRSALAEQLRALTDLNGTLREETINLTRALKGDTRQQGDWGELILEQLLEHAGLQRGVHFAVQESLRDEQGAMLRPDIVIHLPGDRHVIVDSKVSLTAYAELAGTTDDAAREGAIRSHVASVRRHVQGLGDKAYHALYGDRTPDFVILFMPLEGAFLTALRGDQTLTQHAWDRHVIMVSPSTLLFVVRCIAQLWSQEARSRNVQEIADRGARLYEKFVGFVEDLDAVGTQIDRAQASYTAARSKLSTGTGNLVRQAEMLRDLGVKPKKSLPGGMFEGAEEDGTA